MKYRMNTDRHDRISAEQAKKHDDHWEEVLKLAEKYGFIRQAASGTAFLTTHEVIAKWDEEEKKKEGTTFYN